MQPLHKRIAVCLGLGGMMTLPSTLLPSGVVSTGPLANRRAGFPYDYHPMCDCGVEFLLALTPVQMMGWSAPGVDLLYVISQKASSRPFPSGNEAELAGVLTPWLRHSALPYVRSCCAADRPASILIEARGWPARGAWCEYRQDKDWKAHGAFLLDGHRPGVLGLPRTVPYRPIWSGLTINLGFWTAAVGPLVFAPTMFRRLRRRRAGSCVACRYDLAGLPDGAACPECGRAPAGPGIAVVRGR